MTKNLNIHDRFFKKSLSDIRVMKDFCRSHLPKTLLKGCDFNTLKSQPNSFIDKQLRSKISDVLYRVELWQDPGYLYFLCEHQSSADKLLPFRVLRYVVDIMQHHIDQGNDQLPLVFPIVLYHGIQSPYPYTLDLYDLFASPAKAKELCFKPLHLIDLPQIPDKEIRKHGWAAMLELLQKHIREKNIAPIIEKLVIWGIFRYLEQHGAHDYIEAMLYYLIKAAETHDVHTILNMLAEELPSEREKIMIIEEQLRQQGIQIGLQKGMERGAKQERISLAKRMLTAGESETKICQYTDLRMHQLQQLKDETA